ncbi:MAG: tetratricopeptide repeat protein, partial [Tannerellaceae bacterium]|nr:tetratricopeptide repeat protein [Tannerellaceae bacterium]
LETEARLVLAKSLIADGRWEEALPDIEALSEDTHTPQGAEAKYLLAQHWYDTNDDARAIALLEDYAAKGTPHAYWLARSFILWADIYIRQDDPAQARIYLQSLQTNYRGKDDDIPAMITTRLESLK